MAADRRSDDATRMREYSFHVQDNARSCKDGAGVTVRRAAVKAGHLYWRLEVAELRKDPLW